MYELHCVWRYLYHSKAGQLRRIFHKLSAVFFSFFNFIISQQGYFLISHCYNTKHSRKQFMRTVKSCSGSGHQEVCRL